MKKFFLFILILIAICAAGAYIAYGKLPTWISSNLSEKAKVDVNIETIQLDMENIKVANLAMGNPQQSTLKYALKVQDIDVKAPLMNYLFNPITINQIIMDNVYIGLEFYKAGSTDGNWTYIVANLNEDVPQDSSGKEVTIKKVTLKNINIELLTHQNGAKSRKLQPIKQLEFTNVTSTGGIPASQLANAIMKVTLKEIFSLEGIQNMLQNALNPKNVLSPLKNLFSDTEEKEESAPLSSLN